MRIKGTECRGGDYCDEVCAGSGLCETVKPTTPSLVLSADMLEAMDKFESNVHRIRGIRRVPRTGDNDPEVEFLVAFTHKEFQVLKALFQNPHPAYQGNPETMEIAESVFNDIKGVY